LKQAVTIDLSDNFLSGSVPGSLQELQQLRTLSLSLNALTGGFDEMPLWSMGWLEVIRVDHNALGGTFPETIASMTELVILDAVGVHTHSCCCCCCCAMRSSQ
jgi:hypothetical protein